MNGIHAGRCDLLCHGADVAADDHGVYGPVGKSATRRQHAERGWRDFAIAVFDENQCGTSHG
jgi:hypothetical protein